MQISLQPDVEQELKAKLATGIDLNEFIRQALRNNLNSAPKQERGVGLSGRPWREIFADLPPVSDDFMASRKDLPPQERTFFDK